MAVAKAAKPKTEGIDRTQHLVDRIKAAWQVSVNSIIEVGRLVCEALQEVTQQELALRLGFSQNTVSNLKRIGADKRLADYQQIHKLPASWGTLYELTKLEDEWWEEIDIRPDMRRKEISAFIKNKRKDQANSDISKTQCDLDDVYIGDFRERADVIPDGSATLIFTDPPYDRKTVEIYADLFAFAAEKLVQGGSLVTYIGDYALRDVLAQVPDEIEFRYPFVLTMYKGNSKLYKFGPLANLNVKSKLLLWFTNTSKERLTGHIIDTAIDCPLPEKDVHKWQQHLDVAKYFIERLALPGTLVIDPFCGGGTTVVACKELGNQWAAFDVDPAAIAITRDRLNDVC